MLAAANPKDLSLVRVAHGEDPRVRNARHTDLAFKTQAVNLGYAFISHDGLNEDAKDGGQQCFEDYLALDITSVKACTKLLKLAARFREIAANWDHTHVKVAKAETKALNACPKKGIKNMSKAIGALPSNSQKIVKRDSNTHDGKPEGTLIANATTIDGIITRAWQTIFQGNAEDQQKIA